MFVVMRGTNIEGHGGMVGQQYHTTTRSEQLETLRDPPGVPCATTKHIRRC
jgi:hypothetical protein